MHKRIAPFLFFLLSANLVLAVSQSKEGLGVIDFSNSGSPKAQVHFQNGILLLHSFEYEEARQEFLKAQQIDPSFVLAYWGEAMTHNHPLWRYQNKEKALAVLNKLGENRDARLEKASTEREKRYLATLEELYCKESKLKCDRRYALSMQKLYQRYPEDLEAASFYSLALLGTAQGVRNIRTYMKAASISEEVFARNPRHPGAIHYLIHSYDDPIHAPLGMRAARVYSEIATHSPHALHMPSHIFMAMGKWRDSVNSNTASARLALEQNNPNSAFHSLWWKHYSLLQMGRYEEAALIITNMYDLSLKYSSTAARAHFCYMAAAQIVETKDWKSELLKNFDVSELPLKAHSSLLFTQGLQAISQGLVDQALEIDRKLKALLKQKNHLEEDRTVALIMQKQLQASILFLLDQKVLALKHAHDASKLQMQLATEFGPPVPMKPVFEFLGDLLLAKGEPQEAQTAYVESLRYNPGRSLSLLGIVNAAKETGDLSSLTQAVMQLQINWRDGDSNLPILPQIPPNNISW